MLSEHRQSKGSGERTEERGRETAQARRRHKTVVSCRPYAQSGLPKVHHAAAGLVVAGRARVQGVEAARQLCPATHALVGVEVHDIFPAHLQRGDAFERLLGQVAAPGTLPPTPHVGHGGCVGRRQPPGAQGGHMDTPRGCDVQRKSDVGRKSLGTTKLRGQGQGWGSV